MTDSDYADDLALLANTLSLAESLVHNAYNIYKLT